MMMTPARIFRETVCPNAPERKRKAEMFAEHCDLGILPGDFIKPDPTMTRRETQTYLVEEIHRWLTGIICEHAEEIHTAYMDNHRIDLVSYLSGRWPAARLYVLFRLLEKRPDMQEGNTFRRVGEWAAQVCADYLHGTLTVTDPATRLAIGFVDTDELPCGTTIDTFWMYSPFEALRNAPPLTDSEEEDIYDMTPPDSFIIVACIAVVIPLIAAFVRLFS